MCRETRSSQPPASMARTVDRAEEQTSPHSTLHSPGTGTNFEVLWDNRPNVAGQMLSWCFNDSTYRMNGGVPGDPATVLHKAINTGYSYGMKYEEIYQTDVMNLPAEITYAHTLLVSSPTPTPTPSATPPSVPTGFSVVP